MRAALSGALHKTWPLTAIKLNQSQLIIPTYLWFLLVTTPTNSWFLLVVDLMDISG